MVNKEIEEVKDLFWLAEWNTPQMHFAFDATYAWAFHHLSGEIARQSRMIGYINAFTLYTILAFSVIPLIMLVRMPKEEAPAAAE